MGDVVRLDDWRAKGGTAGQPSPPVTSNPPSTGAVGSLTITSSNAGWVFGGNRAG